MDDRNLVPNPNQKVEHTLEPKEGVPAPDPRPASEINQPMGDRDEWKGKPVDANYGFVPQDKDTVTANLKKVEADVQGRFGLEQRGMEDTHEAPAKPDTFQSETVRNDPK